MDPITGAVIAAVLWFVLRSVISAAIVFAGILLGGFVAGATDKPGLGFLIVLVGWLTAIGWEIYAIIQAILEVVRIVQLIGGGA